MSTQTIHRAYNDVVASHYDLDPQGVIGRSLNYAVDQLQKEGFLAAANESLCVLDIGMGTGLFLGKLKEIAGDQIVPFGLDLAENMVENARKRIPDLTGAVGDAARLDEFFPGQQFDCICTHFITGYVPMQRARAQNPRPAQAGGILVAGRRDQDGLSGTPSQGPLAAPSLAERRWARAKSMRPCSIPRTCRMSPTRWKHTDSMFVSAKRFDLISNSKTLTSS